MSGIVSSELSRVSKAHQESVQSTSGYIYETHTSLTGTNEDATRGAVPQKSSRPRVKIETPAVVTEVQTYNENRPVFDWEKVDLREFNRLKSFLGSQPWALEYYDEDDGFHVALSDIKEENARCLLEKQQITSIPVIFVLPSGSKYEPCCDIKPGDRLKNTTSNKEGLYSGSVGSGPSAIYGLTAAHSYQDPEQAMQTTGEIRLFNECILTDLVSSQDHIILEVIREDFQRVTADVRLLRFDDEVRSSNEINIVQGMGSVPEGRYKLTLFRRGVHMLRRKCIVLRNKHRALVEGLIQNFSYTNQGENLFNTVIIESSHNTSDPITEPGDSGALAWLMPPGISGSEVEVVGIVLGRLHHDTTRTVINNLDEVLRYCGMFGTDPPCPPGFYDHNTGTLFTSMFLLFVNFKYLAY